MCGGAITTRLVLMQEISTSVPASPQALTASFFQWDLARLPHRLTTALVKWEFIDFDFGQTQNCQSEPGLELMRGELHQKLAG
jgi:hypothetical protein